jgi:hypothetical protein
MYLYHIYYKKKYKYVGVTNDRNALTVGRRGGYLNAYKKYDLISHRPFF